MIEEDMSFSYGYYCPIMLICYILLIMTIFFIFPIWLLSKLTRIHINLGYFFVDNFILFNSVGKYEPKF